MPRPAEDFICEPEAIRSSKDLGKTPEGPAATPTPKQDGPKQPDEREVGDRLESFDDLSATMIEDTKPKAKAG